MVREEELVQKAKEVREGLIDLAAQEIDATHIEVGQIEDKDDTRKLLTIRVGGANRYVPYAGHDTSEFTVGDYWAVIFDDYGTVRLGWWATNSVGGGTIPFAPHALDPDDGPHAGTLTEDDVVFDDAAGHDHAGAGNAGKKVTAGDVINVPAGGIAATNVQAAIDELDAEKADDPHALDPAGGPHTGPLDPEDVDDFSVNVAEMQTQVDPGDQGSESLATDLSGEIARLRYVIAEFLGTAFWYDAPEDTLINLAMARHVHAYKEDKSAECDGAKVMFFTAQQFEPYTLRMLLNGQEQVDGAANDYIEGVMYDSFTMAVAPIAGDMLIMHYLAQRI